MDYLKKYIFSTQKIILLVVLLAITSVESLPHGAPLKVCDTMLPYHGGGIPPQTSLSRFIVTTIRRPTEIIVTIKSPLQLRFQGFMLQARGAKGQLLMGTFKPVTPGIHALNCNDGLNNTLTHSNTDPRSAVDAHWIAPADYEGIVIFNATVAQDYSTFWAGVESTPVEIQKRSAIDNNSPDFYTTTTTTERLTTTQLSRFPPSITFQKDELVKDLFYDGCSVTKNCFGAPFGCIESQDCTAVVSVTVTGDRYIFDIKGTKSAKWVGVGLSMDAKMGDDSVIECVNEGNSIKAYVSRTIPRPNIGVTRENIPQDGIRLLKSSSVNGTINCQVMRNAVTNINGVKYDLIQGKYNLLVAAGSGLKADSVGYHDLIAEPSSTPIYLAEVSKIAGASKLLYRLHGALMIIAWIGTVSVGTVLARYFRNTWREKSLWGKDIWFAWHRNLMILTWILTSVAFIIIFVEVGTWSTENNPHAILGLVVTILCFVQPIGAYFRPHPGTSKRPIFNWLHWTGGNCAHILAFITIYFATGLTKATLPLWFVWILVAFIIFHILMHLILSIMHCISRKASEESETNGINMKEISGSRKHHSIVTTDDPYTSSRKGLLTLYVVGVTIIVVVMVIVVCIVPV